MAKVFVYGGWDAIKLQENIKLQVFHYFIKCF